MLSLLKKKSEAAAAPAVPNWHPNFRSYEKLPDIKVVRTAFFINGAAIFAALALSTYFGIKEWQLRVLNGQINEEVRKIERDKRQSEQAVALYKKFQTEEARIREVEAFIKSKPIVSSLLMRLGETLPPNIALDNLELRGDGLALRLSVRGEGVAASEHATAYAEQLKTDPQLAAFAEPNFTSTPTRNPTTGRMAVEFFLRYKPAAPGGKK